MKAIAAREAKNRFGTLMDTAQREPVAIEKHGRAELGGLFEGIKLQGRSRRNV